MTVPSGLALFDDFETLPLPALVREGRSAVVPEAFLALGLLVVTGIVAVVVIVAGSGDSLSTREESSGLDMSGVEYSFDDACLC